MNFSEMSKEELIEYIKNIDEQSSGKYGLIWDREKEPEQIVVDCDKKIPILKEIKSKEIKKGGQNNILIEGDNFHALSVLNYTHKEAVDVIYIDPPYNTGNQDFMYNDKFIDVEDGYRHSKWLNFMEKRLRIARELLKESGVIFISIDDNEQAQLKLLCDKVFDERNFIGNIIWHKKTQPSFLTNELITVTEYVLVYRKNEPVKFFGSYSDLNKAVEMLNLSNKKSERYFYKDKVCIGNGFSGEIRKGKYGNGELAIELLDNLAVENGIPDKDIKMIGRFKWGQEKINEALLHGGIMNFKSIKTLRATLSRGKDAVASIKPPINLQSKLINDMATNTDASNELKYLFDGINPMTYPKPTKLIRFILNSVTHDNKNAIILDFFAGSGTTGQAVLELNKEDNGNRLFILCTNNEDNICRQITLPRLEKVMKGYKELEPLEGNLKFFETDFVENSGTRDQLYYDLTEKCIPMLCVRGDTFNMVKVTDEYAIYTNDEKSKYSCIYFDVLNQKYDEFLKEVKKIKELKQLYIFNLGDSVDKEQLNEIDDDNYVVEPIPYKIIELYKKVVKMSKGE